MQVFKLICLFCFFSASYSGGATSLYNQDNYKELTADRRALRVGDTVTVIVMESAHASASAGEADESNFGFNAQAGANDKAWRYGIGVNSATEGSASTQRRGLIRAQITVVVVGVDSNQNLIVRGQQSLTIDGEEQKIEIAGRARRSDITSNNTLISSRLFDAKISLVGQGSVTKGADEGVFAKLFKWLGIK